MAFLDGAPPERLCQPIVDYVTGEAQGGCVWGDAEGGFQGNVHASPRCTRGLHVHRWHRPAGFTSPRPAATAPPACLPAARGGEVRMKAGVKNIELNEDGTVK